MDTNNYNTDYIIDPGQSNITHAEVISGGKAFITLNTYDAESNNQNNLTQEQNKSNIQATDKQITSNQGASNNQNANEDVLVSEPLKKPPLKTLDYRIICKAILKCNGNVAEIAKDLNYNYSNVYNFLKKTKNPTIKRVLEQSKEIILDVAESKLIEHINSIDPRISLDAVKFVLSTLGKNRGFTNKQEIALSQDTLAIPDFDQLKQLKQDFSEILKIDIEQNFIDNQEIDLAQSDAGTINND
jgi:hypothetical protein